MTYFKNQKKWVKVRFAERGGEVVSSDSSGQRWEFPGGRRVWVPSDITAPQASGLVREICAQYSPVGGGARVFGERAGHAPTIDLTRLRSSAHANSRLELMKSQPARLDMKEVYHALRLPERVLWSDSHESWVWVRDRVGVCVAFLKDGTGVITTILWSDSELWAANPRPEQLAGGRR